MKSYAYDMLMNGKRIGGRDFMDFRKIEITPGIIKNAEGSAMCQLGGSKVIVGVKFGTGTPFPDTPDEGTMMVDAEFTPLASPDFEAGPPGEDATELARVVDRGIRHSEAIDFKKFSIKPGEKVWMINVDIHIINHDGNLIDCASMAALAALRSAKIPAMKNEVINREESSGPLNVVHTPIEVTVCKFEDKFLVDPSFEEELVIDSKVTFALDEDDKICAIQKQGPRELTIDDVKSMTEIAIEKSRELRKAHFSKAV
jgi:exosome complex component RRP42